MAKIVYIQEERGGYSFQIEAERYRGPDDFMEAIEALKEAVPSHARHWNPELKRWWVEKESSYKLKEVFSNYSETIEALELQARIF